MLRWPRGVASITFRSDSCHVTEDELKKMIDKQYGGIKLTKAITVRILDIDWILKSSMKFLGLTVILNGTENHSIFVTQFVMQVLDQFWEANFIKLRNR